MRNEIHMEIDTTLIGKYLAGEASPEEAIAIENWIAGSQNNRQVFEQYQKTWNNFQPTVDYQQPDKDLVWQGLETSLPGKKPLPGKGRIFFLKRYAFAAAITGLIVVSGIAWFILNGNHSSGSIIQKEIAANSGFIRDSLPDGTEVVITNKSRLVYPEKFATARREVKLEGEAFFSVKPDASRPFLINIDGVSIRILGTTFNVRRNEAVNEIETQVRTGTVEMFNKEGRIIIHAGQTGIYSKTGNRFSVKDAVDLNSFAYATHELFFNEISLREIITCLEKTYSRRIVLENEALANCKMTSSFDNKPIEYILDIITTTLGIRYNIINGVIYINGKGNC